jgi:hypothetical protein
MTFPLGLGNRFVDIHCNEKSFLKIPELNCGLL